MNNDFLADILVAEIEEEQCAIKVVSELNRWIEAICKADEKESIIRNLCLPLIDPSIDPATLRVVQLRTLRMLLMMRELLCCSTNVEVEKPKHLLIERQRNITEAVENILKEVPELKNVINKLTNQVINVDIGGTKYVSLLLLIVKAIGYSQCERHRTEHWEAFTARRARKELKRQLDDSFPTEAPDDIFKSILDIPALLIRYQSSPGQYSRGTGNDEHIKFLEQHSQRFKTLFKESPKELFLTALKVVGVLEQVRAYPLPGSDHDITILGTKINEQTYGQLELNKLFERVKGLFNQQENTVRCTWKYAQTLVKTKVINQDDLNKFKEQVHNKWNNLIIPTTPSGNQSNNYYKDKVATYNFNRKLGKYFGNELAELIKSANSNQVNLENLFYVTIHKVPHCLEGEAKELVVMIDPHEWIIGEWSLFPSKKIEDYANKYRLPDLISYFYERIIEEYELNRDCLRDEQEVYFPVPLMKRLLDVYDSSRSIKSININITLKKHENSEQKSKEIPIPIELDKVNIDHQKIMILIVRYIHALVMNYAMSEGFHSCSIELDSLETMEYSTNRFVRADWEKKLVEEFEKNGFDILVDHYLRQYNSDDRCLYIRLSTELTMLSPIPIQRLNKTLTEYIEREQKKLTSSEKENRFGILGIDIGGTMTKFQFFEYKEGSFVPKGHAFRVSTPGSVKQRVTSESFAEALVQRIVDEVTREAGTGSEDIRNLVPHIRAVGVSWPGPVKKNERPGGTSGIFARFDKLSRGIKENDVEQIMGLEILESMKKSWISQIPYETPLFVMLNDGDAEGWGVQYRDKERENSKLCIVKLGTGTAGTVFLCGNPDRGLNEWGKILLDLAAPTPTKPIYPLGVANHYLSRNCMPRRARTISAKLKVRSPFSEVFDPKDLDSMEIGYFLKLDFDHLVDSLRSLLEVSGLFALEKRLPGNIDFEILQRIRHKNLPLHDRRVAVVQQELGIEDLKKRPLEQCLGETAVNFGIWRLMPILGLSSTELKDALNGIIGDHARSRLEEAKKNAEESVKSLGRYLGDFCVLLHDLIEMNLVKLDGGVLSGETGRRAIGEAKERIKRYRLRTSRGKESFEVELVSSMEKREEGEKKEDFGPLGAAVFAARSFLHKRREKGLQKVKSMVEQLAPGGTLQDTSLKEISEDYALDENEIESFLDNKLFVLRLHKSPDRELTYHKSANELWE